MTEVKSFLGFVNFCRKFIVNQATLTEPLRTLTMKSRSFKWGKEEEDAFTQLKNEICAARVLQIFDPSLNTIVVSDASPVGLGAILLQSKDGKEKLIACASRSLTAFEKRYSQTEKEALGVVWAYEHFEKYLYGVQFEMRTDHKPLCHLYANSIRPSARVERWKLRL